MTTGWWSVVSLVGGAVVGFYAIAEAKTGNGVIFHGWLLMPPRSYVAAVIALLLLLFGAWLLGRATSR